LRIKVNNGVVGLRRWPLGSADGRIEHFWRLGEPEIAQHLLARNSSVRFVRPKVGEGPARTDYGVKQPARGYTVAKIESVRKNALDTQIVRERAHYMVQTLADKHHLGASGYDFLERFNATHLEPRLQKVLEELFAQKVQAVAALMPENGVQEARGDHAVRGVEKRACDG
jgi:hypothetical protein